MAIPPARTTATIATRRRVFGTAPILTRTSQRTSDYGLPTTDYGLQTTDFGLQTIDGRTEVRPYSYQKLSGLRRAATHGQVRDRAEDADAEDRDADLGSPVRRQAEQVVNRPRARANERERRSRGGIEQRQFDAVRGGKQPFPGVHGDHRHQHHRQHQRGSKRSEKAKRHEQAAGELAQSCRQREPPSWTEPERLEVAARSGQP